MKRSHSKCDRPARVHGFDSHHLRPQRRSELFLEKPGLIGLLGVPRVLPGKTRAPRQNVRKARQDAGAAAERPQGPAEAVNRRITEEEIEMETETEDQGLSLLKKGQRGFFNVVFSRVGIMIVLLVLQVLFLFMIFYRFAQFLPHILGGTVLFTLFMVLYLINTRMDPTAKITWLIVIMLLPVFGSLLYWYTQSEIGHRTVRKRSKQLIDETKDRLPQDPETWKALQEADPNEAAMARYVQRSGCFPVYSNTEVTYFPIGEAKFEEMLKQLRTAKKYIFMEYFIIEEGQMWGKVLEILAEKVREGVEVRVMYDGSCEFSKLPHNYPEKIRQLGIQCKMFAPVTPFLSTHYNYRDHRKILVIDGHTAFTGGINLADEYINLRSRFGHWKDTAVMVKGEAAKSFTLMFLQMWNISEKTAEFDKYLDTEPADGGAAAGNTGAAAGNTGAAGGFVLPYGDCPLDEDKLGERVYMNILYQAREYVHIMSPYLILDGELETALKFAAERGVDVKLILPGIPDKPMPYALAKSHYRSLLDSGVKIYEYTPGFVHAKVFVSDDCRAVVGTINLDYRSLYHHFECAAYMYRTDCIPAIEEDFAETLAKCRQVTPETVKNEKLSVKLKGFVLKAIAPLL